MIPMTDKTYGMMNWRDVEGVICADVTNPHEILGLKNVKGGTLIQAFRQDAESVEIIFDDNGDRYVLTCQDEEGFFALFVRKKLSGLYKVKTVFKDGSEKLEYDAYQFKPVFDKKILEKFAAGINYEVYNYLGAHKDVVNGIEGVRFAVWAPEAVRVSVVGSFNAWDGRCHIMTKSEEYGVFEIFVPDVKAGDLYKFEICKKGGEVVMKSDPYGFLFERSSEMASIVCDIDTYKWKDSKWYTGNKQAKAKAAPVLVYEVRPENWKDADGKNLSYKELAVVIAEYAKENKYTHVELMPVMEYRDDMTMGYQTFGYYAATSRYGTPDDFMYFVDYMHKNGLHVILDWVPAYFPKYDSDLGRFDGSGLYEHVDERQGEHKRWNAYVYNYGRPQVSNFLIANALFWVEKYHVDGLRINSLASMLYLDYDREDGQWIPNIYGGKENLEAVEFIKHLNSIMKKRNKNALVIAEDSSGWPMVTGDVNDGESLGFDYKWNSDWKQDFMEYMKREPQYRSELYDELTLSMVYAYSEKYMLALSHDEAVGSGLIDILPGNAAEKLANLRALCGFMITHPGKKMLSVKNDISDELKLYVKDLNNLYVKEPALWEKDDDAEGFRWINCISSEKSIVSFIRQGKAKADFIVVVCNFGGESHINYRVGVPMKGKYKEIFNSDNVIYGGAGFINPRVKASAKKPCDDMEESISINLPATSIAIFKFRQGEE